MTPELLTMCLDDEQIAALACGELPDHLRIEVDAHLDDCAACRHLVALVATGRDTTSPQKSDTGIARPVPSGPGPDTASRTGRWSPQQERRCSGKSADLTRLAGRFTVGRALGAGAFGVVFEAQEDGRTAKVALKKLRLADASALYHFKQEFRALADVVHPNLVALHELFSDGSDFYLSMELVDGVGFLDYVRRKRSRSSTDADVARSPVVLAALDVGRLRAALRQLAEGIAAIHRAGKLHRDLKPSNVFVTADGRVKVLDFGLIASLPAPSAPRHEVERHVVGTPAYMSPEQAMGSPLSPASDWYAFGVMLYQALTGWLPIDGSTRDILANKLTLDPHDPRLLVANLPDDLADLSVGLQQRCPSDRPTESAIFAALGGDGTDPRKALGVGAEMLPFVGRAPHLASLEDAFTTARCGKVVTLQVHGTSGMGKSALIRRFLDGAADRDGAVVLEGPCYERESVPYKGVDSLIDALAQHLRTLPPGEAERLVPPDVQALARVFPVLLRVDAVQRAPRRADAPDPVELRRRAFGALRELLARMAAVKPLVVWIDDFQWGDDDSATLLLDLLDPSPDGGDDGPPSGAPALLLIASYRTEDAATIAFVRGLRERLSREEIESDVRELWVGPLVHHEALALAHVLLASDPEGRTSEQIATESGGSPLFVHELARHVRTRHPVDTTLDASGPVSLHQVLTARLARLDADARRLLEILAVAGRPIAQGTACAAAEVERGARNFALLRSEHLVRSRATGGLRDEGGDATGVQRGYAEHADVECFHDRIRETVLASLSPADTAARHGALADVLEAAGGDDVDAILVHLLGKGDTARALRFVEIAAERAEAALAFDRAAGLLRKAIELHGTAPQPLRKRLAHALANAGRGALAARAYLDATRDAPADEALDLRRRAAEKFLHAGHIDEGLTVIQGVLADVGLELPKTPNLALASLLFRRAQLALRGTRFTERAAASIPARDLARIDVCWSVGSGLFAVDVIRGVDFQARHLLLALRAGEPYRIARALALEAVQAAFDGGARGRARAAILAARSAELAARIGHPHAIAWAASAAAGVAYYSDRFRQAVELCDHAIALFRATCTDAIWEIGSLQAVWLLGSLVFLGDMDDVARRLPPCLHEAQEFGALYNEVSLRIYSVPRMHLTLDRPSEARRESADALASWSKRGWDTQHYRHLLIRVASHLYESKGETALAQMRKDVGAVAGSQLLRVELVRSESAWLHSNALVLTARQGHHDRAALLREAQRYARTLAKGSSRLAQAYATQLNAGIALARGRLDHALALYEGAALAFEDLEMNLHAAASRRRQGELLGGEEGRELVRASEAAMTARRVRSPERMAAMLAPV